MMDLVQDSLKLVAIAGIIMILTDLTIDAFIFFFESRRKWGISSFLITLLILHHLFTTSAAVAIAGILIILTDLTIDAF